MQSQYSDNNPLVQYYKQMDLERLKSTIAAIKTRKPLLNIIYDIHLPQVINKFARQESTRIQEENARLWNKIRCSDSSPYCAVLVHLAASNVRKGETDTQRYSSRRKNKSDTVPTEGVEATADNIATVKSKLPKLDLSVSKNKSSCDNDPMTKSMKINGNNTARAVKCAPVIELLKKKRSIENKENTL